jgi:hypothetical protein
MIVWITHVKVGHRQTPYNKKAQPKVGLFYCRKNKGEDAPSERFFF